MCLVNFVSDNLCEQKCYCFTDKRLPFSTADCTIHEVRIDPCPEAKKNEACEIVRGKKMIISFDYTTNFDTSKSESNIYWAKTATSDLPFAGMDKNTCKYTQCPIASGVKQTYSHEKMLDRKLPTVRLIKYYLGILFINFFRFPYLGLL